MGVRFDMAVTELRNRFQSLDEPDMYGERGEIICEHIAGDYGVSYADLHQFMMSEFFLPE